MRSSSSERPALTRTWPEAAKVRGRLLLALAFALMALVSTNEAFQMTSAAYTASDTSTIKVATAPCTGGIPARLTAMGPELAVRWAFDVIPADAVVTGGPSRTAASPLICDTDGSLKLNGGSVSSAQELAPGYTGLVVFGTTESDGELLGLGTPADGLVLSLEAGSLVLRDTSGIRVSVPLAAANVHAAAVVVAPSTVTLWVDGDPTEIPFAAATGTGTFALGAVQVTDPPDPTRSSAQAAVAEAALVTRALPDSELDTLLDVTSW